MTQIEVIEMTITHVETCLEFAQIYELKKVRFYETALQNLKAELEVERLMAIQNNRQ